MPRNTIYWGYWCQVHTPIRNFSPQEYSSCAPAQKPGGAAMGTNWERMANRIRGGALAVSVLLTLGVPRPAGAQVSFTLNTDFATGASPRSVAVADVNEDGKLDLVVANYNTHTVSVLLGTGTGSFGAKTDYATGSFPIAVAAADLNGDGHLDLVVANFNDSTVSVLLGTGTGSFGAKTDFATGETPAAVAVADLNGDGRLDLVVANGYANTVSVLLGTGTGSFGGKSGCATWGQPLAASV